MNVEQRSPEWFAARLGKVTGSRVADVMAATKSGYSASRENYMTELLIQRLTGQIEEHFVSGPMQWGIDQEPFARGAWEAKNGKFIEECGFIQHPTIANFGASPDGLIDGAVIEIKCPESNTQLKSIFKGYIKPRYIYQMQAQMMVTGLDRAIFISFDPRLPGNLQLWEKEIPLDKNLAEEIGAEVKKFLDELDALEKNCRLMM